MSGTNHQHISTSEEEQDPPASSPMVSSLSTTITSCLSSYLFPSREPAAIEVALSSTSSTVASTLPATTTTREEQERQIMTISQAHSFTSNDPTVATESDDDDDYSHGVVEWTLQEYKKKARFSPRRSTPVRPKTNVHAHHAANKKEAQPSIHHPEKPVPSGGGGEQKEKQRRRCLLWGLLVGALLLLTSAGVATLLMFKKSASSISSEEQQSASAEEGPSISTETDETRTTPTSNPTLAPATPAPTANPSSNPTVASYEARVVNFAAIGDVPYSSDQARILRDQMKDYFKADSGLDFAVHVGDLRSAEGKPTCYRSEYEESADILKRSEIPVFVLPGDNDIWDCPNSWEGREYWEENFDSFDTQHWDHSFDVQRHPGSASFSFVHQDILFLGVDIVEQDDWEEYLQDQVAWTLEKIREYDLSLGQYTGRVVIFAQPDPKDKHATFFDPLEEFIELMENRIPILYVNGDGHKWSYDEDFYDQESFLRIMLRGEAEEPPTNFRVLATGDPLPIDLAFEYDRQLER